MTRRRDNSACSGEARRRLPTCYKRATPHDFAGISGRKRLSAPTGNCCEINGLERWQSG
jgi:hypothetical protein